MREIIIFLLVVILFLSAQATIVRVPEDFSTIQSGIDASKDGDTVFVAPGVYPHDGNPRIKFKGKAILLKSTAGAKNTIVNQIISFENGEDSNSILDGITVAHTIGGVICVGSAPIIRNCIFSENVAPDYGGGAFIRNSTPVFQNCIFQFNIAFVVEGGGLYGINSDIILESCIFFDNTSFCDGGAIHLDSCLLIMSNTTIAYNNYMSGGFAISGDNVELIMENCLSAFNFSFFQSWIKLYNSSKPVVTNCNFFSNEGSDWSEDLSDYFGISGNISEDPLFCNRWKPEQGIFERSPCAPDNNSSGRLIGASPVGCRCGDIDYNHLIDINDVIQIIDYLFVENTNYSMTRPMDVDCSGIVDISDVVYIIDYLFTNGVSPCTLCL